MLLDLSDLIIELVAITAPEKRSFAALRMTLEEIKASLWIHRDQGWAKQKWLVTLEEMEASLWIPSQHLSP